MYANPKNLRRGDLILTTTKSGSKETTLHGSRLRVLSVSLPFVFVDYWNANYTRFYPSPWNVSVDDYDIKRLHRNAVKPIARHVTRKK